jgi:hypothetical protein
MTDLKLKLINEYNNNNVYRKKLMNKDWINQNKSLIEGQLKKYKTEKELYLKFENIQFIGEECNFLLYGKNLDLYVITNFGLFSKNKWVRHNLFKKTNIETSQRSLRDLLQFGIEKKYFSLLNQKNTKNIVIKKSSELDKIKTSVTSKIKEIDEQLFKDSLIDKLVSPWVELYLKYNETDIKSIIPISNRSVFDVIVSKSTQFVYIRGERERVKSKVKKIDWSKSKPFEFRISYNDLKIKPTVISVNNTKKYLNLLDELYKSSKKDKEVVQQLSSKTQKLLDKDNNKLLDITEINDFDLLIRKYQKDIISKGDYIQKFVKINLYFQKKSKFLNELYLNILQGKQPREVESTLKSLNEGVKNYEKLYVNSLIMINSLLEDELINFYTLYEFFDEVGVFDTQWEKTMLNSQQQILRNTEITNQYLSSLSKQISQMESNITQSVDKLMKSNREMFLNLNSSIVSRLNSINSNLVVNNVLTGIQTYQLYKISSGSKPLLS